MPKTGSFSLEIDDKTFTKNAKKFLTDLGKTEKEFVREQSSFLARDLAKYTPPYVSFPTGNKNTVGTAKDIKAGKDALAMGLYSICHIRKKKTINWARKAFGNGPIMNKGRQIASGVIDDIETLSRWHYGNRKANGRTKDVAKSDRPFVYSAVFNKYLRRRLQDVGVAKASFYKASLHLGGKHNAVKAIKLNLGKATGKGSIKKDRDGYTGIVSGLSKGGYNTKKYLPMIQKDRSIKALKRLRILANDAARKAKLNDR